MNRWILLVVAFASCGGSVPAPRAASVVPSAALGEYRAGHAYFALQNLDGRTFLISGGHALVVEVDEGLRLKLAAPPPGAADNKPWRYRFELVRPSAGPWKIRLSQGDQSMELTQVPNPWAERLADNWTGVELFRVDERAVADSLESTEDELSRPHWLTDERVTFVGRNLVRLDWAKTPCALGSILPAPAAEPVAFSAPAAGQLGVFPHAVIVLQDGECERLRGGEATYPVRRDIPALWIFADAQARVSGAQIIGYMSAVMFVRRGTTAADIRRMVQASNAALVKPAE